MNLRLMLTVTALLVCTPIVFGQACFHPHMLPFAGWMMDRSETVQTEPAGVRNPADCVIVGVDMFRRTQPIGRGNAASVARPNGLASGGHVICTRVYASGI